MQKSFVATFLTLALAAFGAAACGDDDDGDGMADAAAGNPDSAIVLPDGAVSMPDGMVAMPDAGGGMPVMGLGQVCTTGAPCPATGATVCADLDQPADMGGFCTLSCGTGPLVTDPTMATPPAGGDAMCAAQYEGTSGTPMCVLYSNNMAMNMATWYCGVLCGMAGGMDFGMCPGGLTCTAQNLCDD